MGKTKIFKNLATHLGLTCGCGSGCQSKSNIADVYEPKPKVGSSMFNTDTCTCTCISPSTISSLGKKSVTASALVLAPASTTQNIGTAVEMVSMNPYKDFQDSMMEMIVENEILCTEQLVQLLHCFLSLNSPAHHHIILTAFFQVCQYAVVPFSN
ncbi:transcription repressor OFP6-like [Amaranthus tricolor]|uniref:transcription repressor OFP6-like n=1 Tax=Amaranthus tricolor TaxID=29722 RepID=UPI002582C709|nr:transcription repressor OFP6-like [Amaranthus tricolor]